MSELGKQIGVETPVIDSVVKIVSIVMNKDYRSEKNYGNIRIRRI